MNNSVITMDEFFGLKGKGLTKAQFSAIEKSEKIDKVREKLTRAVATISWSDIYRQVIERIEDILNVDMVDIMTMAWSKSETLIKYLDKEKYSPDEIILVPLAEHTIKSTHRPYIELLLNDKSVGRLDFDITIYITLKGMILKIQGGKIREIMAGSCQGKGEIKCEGLLIAEKKPKSIRLPYSINVDHGVSIGS